MKSFPEALFLLVTNPTVPNVSPICYRLLGQSIHIKHLRDAYIGESILITDGRPINKMENEGWLEISSCSTNGADVVNLDDFEVRPDSPLAKVLEAGPKTVAGRSAAAIAFWQYSLRLSLSEIEEMRSTGIFRTTAEDGKSKKSEAIVSLKGVRYDLALFITK